jgi:hypothetical protein
VQNGGRINWGDEHEMLVYSNWGTLRTSHIDSLRCNARGEQTFNKTLTKDDKKRINIAVLKEQNIGGIAELLNAIGLVKAKFHGTRGVHEAVVQKIAHTLSQYAAVVDIMIQQQPNITAVVWGSIRFLLQVKSPTRYMHMIRLTSYWSQVAVNESEVIEAIGEGLADIVEQIARWHKYLQLYPTSSLKEKISSLYAQIINFLVRAKSHYNKPWAGEQFVWRETRCHLSEANYH